MTPEIVLYTGRNGVPNVWCRTCNQWIDTGKTVQGKRPWSEVQDAVRAHIRRSHEEVPA